MPDRLRHGGSSSRMCPWRVLATLKPAPVLVLTFSATAGSRCRLSGSGNSRFSVATSAAKDRITSQSSITSWSRGGASPHFPRFDGDAPRQHGGTKPPRRNSFGLPATRRAPLFRGSCSTVSCSLRAFWNYNSCQLLTRGNFDDNALVIPMAKLFTFIRDLLFTSRPTRHSPAASC